MPLYEFICHECENIFELLATKEGDLVEIKFPTYDSDNLERVMSKGWKPQVVIQAKKQTLVENRSCSSGTCSMTTLPDHTR
jgi:hypothetical protein